MKTKKYRKIILITCSLATAFMAGSFLSGCVSHSKEVQTSAPTSSVGQQLQDLDKAYKDGIITQKQYEELKKSLIKKND
jgi:hypothetical protein